MILIFLPIFITHLQNETEGYQWNATQEGAWATGFAVSIALGMSWLTSWTEMGHKGEQLFLIKTFIYYPLCM